MADISKYLPAKCLSSTFLQRLHKVLSIQGTKHLPRLLFICKLGCLVLQINRIMVVWTWQEKPLNMLKIHLCFSTASVSWSARFVFRACEVSPSALHRLSTQSEKHTLPVRRVRWTAALTNQFRASLMKKAASLSAVTEPPSATPVLQSLTANTVP